DAGDTATQTAEAEGDAESDRSILWDTYGMAMLPHGNFPILDCLMSIYLHADNPDGLLAVYERHLATAEATETWQPIVYRLIQVRPQDPQRLANFVRALFARHPALLGTRESGYFLGNLHWSQPALIQELIMPCLGVPRPRLQQFFGELA